MPDLYHFLRNQDLGFHKLVAEKWSIELPAGNSPDPLQVLISAMSDPVAIREILELLPEDAHTALNFILQSDGKIPWLTFERKFGEIRDMGAGRRDRERPDMNPISVSERLWYYGLLGRSFFDEKPYPQEFVFIPEEISLALTSHQTKAVLPPGRPAEKESIPAKIFSTDRIVDDICTLLAALRKKQPFLCHLSNNEPGYEDFIQTILRQCRVISDNGLPVPEVTRKMLESPRGEVLYNIATTWLSSTEIKDIDNISGLEFEGPVKRDPLANRGAIVQLISLVPQDTWWNINSFIQYVKKSQPDFLRMAGDYDAWFVKEKQSGEYINGFANWEKVEGRLIQYYLTGPIHWLGLIDLASIGKSAPVNSFRLSDLWNPFVNHEGRMKIIEENEPLFVKSNGTIIIPRLAPRSIRYLIARYCEWAGEIDANYVYRISDRSLSEVSAQGLNPGKLILLLRKYCAQPLPPNLIAALERWEKVGSQARLNNPTILTFSNKKMLDDILKGRATRFFGERLNPVSIIIKPGSENKIIEELLELGVFVKVEKQNQV